MRVLPGAGLVLVVLVSFLFCQQSLAQDASVAEAQKLFKQFVEMERTYDPAQAELYSPEAIIKDTRLYNDGQNKTLSWTGESYRPIVRAQMQLARARGEQFNYSQTSFSREGAAVRIKSQRAQLSKKFNSPFEMLVSANKAGVWKITEESFQSQP